MGRPIRRRLTRVAIAASKASSKAPVARASPGALGPDRGVGVARDWRGTRSSAPTM